MRHGKSLTTAGDFLSFLHFFSYFQSYHGDAGHDGDSSNKQDTWPINSLTRFKLAERLGFFFFLFNFFSSPSQTFPVLRITPKGVKLVLNVHLWLATFL